MRGKRSGMNFARPTACTTPAATFLWFIMFRRGLFFLALTALVSLSTNCSKNPAPAAKSAGGTGTAAAGGAKKILHFGNQAEPQDLDPHTVTGVPEHRLALTFYEGL